MTKRNQLLLAFLFFLFLPSLYAQQPKELEELPKEQGELSKEPGELPKLQGDWNELFAGPATPSARESWLKGMKEWRAAERARLKYNGAGYLRPAIDWVRRSYIYAHLMAHDRFFYDPVSGKYTVDRYLNDLKKRYGGIDAVLIWCTYPNIGVDNRNQFDLLKAMPGGIAGLKKMVAEFKKRGVRVFFPIMIWDHGTRKITLSMPEALSKEMQTIGADGMFGDTMSGVDEEFQHACETLHYPVVLQPELTIGDLKMIEWNPMSYGYYWKYAQVPGVSIYKWFESGHQIIVTNRWAIDKTDDLQYAFFNGIGYNAWENIWGIWNQVPDRFASAIRRIAAIYRQFPKVWSSGEWEPHIPTLQKGVFASRFSAGAVSNGAVSNGGGSNGGGSDGDQTIYTLVNRDSLNIGDRHGDQQGDWDRQGDQQSPRQLKLPYREGIDYFDVWNGVKLTPQREGQEIVLSFPIEGRGFGAIAAIRTATSGVWASQVSASNTGFNKFLDSMHRMSEIRLKDLPAVWKPLPQQIVPIERTSPALNTSKGLNPLKEPDTEKRPTTPTGMVLIPGTNDYIFESRGIMVEGNELPDAVGVQHPWEAHPSRSQKHKMEISPFYMDKYPVTNKQFQAFMKSTHYRPRDAHNFLRDWRQGMYPKGWDDKPVTWISMEDARAYAKWAGKRLPHEWEWQYAAQGKDNNLYPWGNSKDSTRMPMPDTSRNMRYPGNVNEFPRGASSFGVMDLVGNVWQWTDEYTDEHTRAAILKGGSYFNAQSSSWYFPQAYELNTYGKYLLLAPGIDRSGTIGFRCVQDRGTEPEAAARPNAPGAQLSDSRSTKETTILYNNLRKLGKQYTLFGHQDDLAYGVNWQYNSANSKENEPGVSKKKDKSDESKSDVKDVVKDYPAVYGWDLSMLELDSVNNINGIPFSKMKQFILEGYQRGGVITISWHLNNPLTGGSAWDTTDNTTVRSILPGGEKHQLYRLWLTKIAAYLGSLRGSKGEYIPVLFRPFHELTGNWFWWCKNVCTPDEFRQLWRFTTDYLRNEKKIHNLIYVYNTAGFTDEAGFLERYPGDDVVDILSLDIYDYAQWPKGQFIKTAHAQLQILCDAAKKKNKPAALAETGLEAVPDPEWWTKTLMPAMEGLPLVYVLLWRNAGLNPSTGKMHYYVPYAGQASAADFSTFSRDPKILFEKKWMAKVNTICIKNGHGQ